MIAAENAADSADEDSDEEAVADALVGARRLSDRDLGDRSNAPPPPSSLFGGSADGSDHDSDSESDEDEAEVENVSDIEEAVLEQVGEEDDLGADETLPFEFESASDESDADASDGEAEGTADESGLPRATRTRKRRRVDSDSAAATAAAGLLLDEEDVDSRATSRAGSHDETTFLGGPSEESMFIARAIGPALSPPPPPASHAFLSMSTSTPARPTAGSAAPPPPLSFPDTGRAIDDDDDDEEDEDSNFGAGDGPEEGEVADRVPLPVVGGTTTALPDEISAALSALRAASGISSTPVVVDPSSSSAYVTQPDNNSPVIVGNEDALRTDRQPVMFSTAAAPAPSTGAPVPKASYERKRVDLGSLDQTPPGAPAAKRFKLSYKPSPLSS